MKKIFVAILVVVFVTLLTGCAMFEVDQAAIVSENLTKEADSFNIVRQVTVINCIQSDVLFQMTGKLSITADRADNQLEIIVEDNGIYSKHFIGLSDNVTYVVEDLALGENDVSNYHYTIYFNPKMWLPYDMKVID